MDEQAVRSLIRDAIARHMGQAAPHATHATHATLTQPRPTRPNPAQPDSSHVLYAGLVNLSDACVIEPTVPCDHCGYCKSHGH